MSYIVYTHIQTNTLDHKVVGFRDQILAIALRQLPTIRSQYKAQGYVP